MPEKPFVPNAALDSQREKIERIISDAKRTRRSFACSIESESITDDILSWVACRREYPRFYFRSPEGDFEIGAAGAVDGFELSIQSLSVFSDRSAENAASNVFCINVGSFDNQNIADSIWGGFPGRTALLPVIALVRHQGRIQTHLNVVVRPDDTIDDIFDRLETLSGRDKAVPREVAPCLTLGVKSVIDEPDYHRWSEIVLKALNSIRSGEIDKVVFSRRRRYALDKPVPPWSLLARLGGDNPHCFAILWQPDEERAFISVSPERLYRRNGDQIVTDALSSTIIRGETEKEDQLLERILQESDKEKREHAYVVSGIAEALAEVCQGDPDIGERSVRKLPRVQHLYSSISAVRAPEISDADILQALHPTPAVGGTPRGPALTMMRMLEPFARGWYAAPIGVVSSNFAEFAVGIRSALLRGTDLYVFCGAGIVRGSEPDAEWRELDNKDIVAGFITER